MRSTRLVKWLILSVTLAGVGAGLIALRNNAGQSTAPPSGNPTYDVTRDLFVESERFASGSTALQVSASEAFIDSGFSQAAADRAATALEDYVSATGSHDIDALVAFAEAHGAEVDPTSFGPVKQMLQVLPDHAKPAGSSEWSDLDILRNTQYKTKFRVWGAVDAEQVEVVRFQGPDTLVDEMKFYLIGPQPGGGYASIHAAPFRVRDLELKLQQGDAAGAVVTFPVTDDNGAKQVISVLLGEYAPGKWYPVRHRTVSSKPRS